MKTPVSNDEVCDEQFLLTFLTSTQILYERSTLGNFSIIVLHYQMRSLNLWLTPKLEKIVNIYKRMN